MTLAHSPEAADYGSFKEIEQHEAVAVDPQERLIEIQVEMSELALVLSAGYKRWESLIYERIGISTELSK